MLHDDQAEARVREQRQELGPGVVEAGPDRLDHLCSRIAARRALGDHPLCLAVEGARVLGR